MATLMIDLYVYGWNMNAVDAALIYFQDASAYEASQEIDYLDNVIQESLRLYPPGPRYV